MNRHAIIRLGVLLDKLVVRTTDFGTAGACVITPFDAFAPWEYDEINDIRQQGWRLNSERASMMRLSVEDGACHAKAM